MTLPRSKNPSKVYEKAKNIENIETLEESQKYMASPHIQQQQQKIQSWLKFLERCVLVLEILKELKKDPENTVKHGAGSIMLWAATLQWGLGF